MRENRTYGSEGGEGQTLPDPYRRLLLHRDERTPCDSGTKRVWCRPFRESEDAEETYANLRSQVLGRVRLATTLASSQPFGTGAMSTAIASRTVGDRR